MNFMEMMVAADKRRDAIVKLLKDKEMPAAHIAQATGYKSKWGIQDVLTDLVSNEYIRIVFSQSNKAAIYTAIKDSYPIRTIEEIKAGITYNSKPRIPGGRIVRLENRREGWTKHELRPSGKNYVSGATAWNMA